MMEIALGLMACAVFAAFMVFAVTAALKSARVDDIIGEVFSPWIEDPFGEPRAARPPEARRSDAPDAKSSGEAAAPADRQPIAGRV